MAESVGMQIVNQRTKDILRVMATHELTIMDLKRVALRFHTFAALIDNNVLSLQKTLAKGGDGGL